jgi:hypothetical protein
MAEKLLKKVGSLSKEALEHTQKLRKEGLEIEHASSPCLTKRLRDGSDLTRGGHHRSGRWKQNTNEKLSCEPLARALGLYCKHRPALSKAPIARDRRPS